MNFDCCAGRTWTSDLQLMRLTSYQLLYRAMFVVIGRIELPLAFAQPLWRINPPLLLGINLRAGIPLPVISQCHILIYKNYAKVANFYKKSAILLVISCLSDSILVEIPKGSPLVAVHKEPPLYPLATFKHKCPGSTLRNLEIVLVFGPGKPY